MTQLTQDFVIEEFANYYGRRGRLIADCEEEPEITRDILQRIEQLRGLAVKVDLSAGYLELIDELIVDLAVIAEKEYYGDGD
jgi:hypothetical protein